MYQFLKDLHRYCVRFKICFGDLSYEEQKVIIYKCLKFTLSVGISKNQRLYIKGKIPFELISKNYLLKK